MRACITSFLRGHKEADRALVEHGQPGACSQAMRVLVTAAEDAAISKGLLPREVTDLQADELARCHFDCAGDRPARAGPE